VAHHLVAYEGKKNNKLFVGAVPESPFWPTLRTVPEMEFQYQRLLQNSNCPDIQCLRSLSLDAFQAASPNSPFPGGSDSPVPLWYWLPVIDGGLVPDRMYDLFQRGDFVRVPLLVGDDTNEGASFAPSVSSQSQVAAFMKNNYPHLSKGQLQAILKKYPKMAPLPKHGAYFPSAAAAYGDSTFTCAGNEMAETLAKYFDPQCVWNYRYNVLDPGNVAAGIGVPHTFETTAIFGLGFAGSGAASYSTTNAAIIPVTMDYFISFVRSLNPNRFRLSTAPDWEPWGKGTGRRLKLQTNETTMEGVPSDLTSHCAFWRSLADTMEL